MGWRGAGVGLALVAVLSGCAATGTQVDEAPSGTPTIATTSSPAAHVKASPRTAEPAPTACRSAQLGDVTHTKRKFGLSVDGETYLFATDFSVENRSASACIVSGWPGLTLEQGPDGVPHGATIDHIGSSPKAVTVSAGGRVQFSVLSDGVACLDPAVRLDIRVQGDSGAVRVPDPDVCAYGPVSISPFGTLAHYG